MDQLEFWVWVKYAREASVPFICDGLTLPWASCAACHAGSRFTVSFEGLFIPALNQKAVASQQGSTRMEKI